MDPPPLPPPPLTSDSKAKKPLRKRPKNAIKPTLFDIPRARNCGADNSFLSTETTGIMDYTCGGSDTEEEDMTEVESEYLNRMTDDNDRPIETCFGKGVKVWKSFSGSGRIYTDLEDHVKKQQHAELVWKDEKKKLGIGAGGKRKRGAKAANEGVPGVRVKYGREMDYSMQVKMPVGEETPDENQMLINQMSDEKETPDPNKAGTYTDGTITYPDLPVLVDSLVANTGLDLPPSPTESEWNNSFRLPMSQVEDIRETIPAPDTLPPELLRQALKENMFHCSGAGVHRAGNLSQSVQSIPTPGGSRAFETSGKEAHDVHMAASDVDAVSSTGVSSSAADTPSSTTGVTTPSSPYKNSTIADGFMAFCYPETPPSSGGRWGFISSLAGGARRMVSDSFGGPDDGPVDRFDDRAYRLGQKGNGEQKTDKGKAKVEEGDKDGKPNPFKGRPWLRKL